MSSVTYILYEMEYAYSVCKRFRRILKLDAKRKMKNNEKQFQNNMIDIETPQQTSAGR